MLLDGYSMAARADLHCRLAPGEAKGQGRPIAKLEVRKRRQSNARGQKIELLIAEKHDTLCIG